MPNSEAESTAANAGTARIATTMAARSGCRRNEDELVRTSPWPRHIWCRQGLHNSVRDFGTVPLTHRVQWMSNIDAARGGVLEFTQAFSNQGFVLRSRFGARTAKSREARKVRY